MNSADRIKQLQDEIEIERRKIQNCKHEFDTPFYNPEKYRKPYGTHLVKQGSDVWPEPEGYIDAEKQRWTRTCKHCGFEEHTYEQKPVISRYEPDFKK